MTTMMTIAAIMKKMMIIMMTRKRIMTVAMRMKS